MFSVRFSTPLSVQVALGVGASPMRASQQPVCPGMVFHYRAHGKRGALSPPSGSGCAALLAIPAVLYKAITVLLASCFWKAS